MITFYFDGKDVRTFPSVNETNKCPTTVNPRETTCVSCGEEVPEGSQVCLKCLKG